MEKGTERKGRRGVRRMIGIIWPGPRLTVHFRNQYLQFTPFKVHSGEKIPYYPSPNKLIISGPGGRNEFSPKREFFGLKKEEEKNQCRHCAL